MTSSYLVGLLGSGVSESLTPLLHEREADAQGLRYLYRTIDIDRFGCSAAEGSDLVRAASIVGYDALNITYPFKQAIFDALDELSPEAELLGAVNTVLFRSGRAIGLNTDHSGFTAGMRAGLVNPVLNNVVLLGAGGAGSAIAYALLSMGTQQLSIYDPKIERAVELQQQMSSVFDTIILPIGVGELSKRMAQADGVVNASPVGMTGHPGMPMTQDLLRPEMWVADAVYRPLNTEFIQVAAARGCAVLDGGGMVVGQASDAFQAITGHVASTERLRAHFLELTRVQEGRLDR